MKISGYYKAQGNNVKLINWSESGEYNKVYVSKVFNYTPFDQTVLNMSHVEHGGTGFYELDSSNLPTEIEHHMPDYELYSTDDKKLHNEYYNASIGFTTRGCFRKCPFV